MRNGRFRAWELVAALALIAALVAGFLLTLVLAPAGSTFEGTDAALGGLVAAEPWVEPLFSPGDLGTEVESGLFALQAGIGGTVLGYALGRLTRRRVPPDATGE